MPQRTIDELTHEIIGAGVTVHRAFGPGLLESAYHTCLAEELRFRGLPFEAQKTLDVRYRSAVVTNAYRLDLVVDKRVIVEVKAIKAFEAIHLAQLLTYLRLCDLRVGLLMNFNVTLLLNGVRRVANDHRG